MSQEDLYGQQVIQLWRNPTNYGEITGADVRVRESNPLCGDEVEFFLQFKKPHSRDPSEVVISKASFTGNGCAISKASCSLLAQDIEGKTIGQVLKLSPKRVYELLGVQVSPTRVKCAMLSMRAVKAAALKAFGKKAGLLGMQRQQ
jgi:nitrogen fixation NifU-like protein